MKFNEEVASIKQEIEKLSDNEIKQEAIKALMKTSLFMSLNLINNATLMIAKENGENEPAIIPVEEVVDQLMHLEMKDLDVIRKIINSSLNIRHIQQMLKQKNDQSEGEDDDAQPYRSNNPK